VRAIHIRREKMLRVRIHRDADRRRRGRVDSNAVPHRSGVYLSAAFRGSSNSRGVSGVSTALIP
jgi:hypothetical protein